MSRKITWPLSGLKMLLRFKLTLCCLTLCCMLITKNPQWKIYYYVFLHFQIENLKTLILYIESQQISSDNPKITTFCTLISLLKNRFNFIIQSSFELNSIFPSQHPLPPISIFHYKCFSIGFFNPIVSYNTPIL